MPPIFWSIDSRRCYRSNKEKLLSERYSPIPGYWGKKPLEPEMDEIAVGSFKIRVPPEKVPAKLSDRLKLHSGLSITATYLKKVACWQSTSEMMLILGSCLWAVSRCFLWYRGDTSLLAIKNSQPRFDRIHRSKTLRTEQNVVILVHQRA